jgi:hypothetical protein
LKPSAVAVSPGIFREELPVPVIVSEHIRRIGTQRRMHDSIDLEGRDDRAIGIPSDNLVRNNLFSADNEFITSVHPIEVNGLKTPGLRVSFFVRPLHLNDAHVMSKGSNQ